MCQRARGLSEEKELAASVRINILKLALTARHYDVVVLGRALGSLACAALLARRDFRVLVLGQGQHSALYALKGRLLARRATTLLSPTSPCYKRILHELAQTQRFRGRTHQLDPMFAVLAPGRRIEVPPNIERFSRAIEREFPEVRQLVDELYSTFAHVNAVADGVFEKDAVWPPGSFWERLETGRLSSQLPFINGDGQRDLMGKFPVGHAYRQITTLPAMFASNLSVPADQMPAFALARLHGAWTRGVHTLPGGEDGLSKFLLERIEAHGGSCELGQRAASIQLRPRGGFDLQLDNEEEPTGASMLVTDLSGEALVDLFGGSGISSKARYDWPRLTATAGRFVMSMVVKTRALPAPLPTESFVIPYTPGRKDPRKPVVHLQRFDPADLGEAYQGPADETLLVGEIILPTRGPLTLLEARQAIWDTLDEHLPFLREHLVLVDSPYDGMPAEDYTTGHRRDLERIHIPNTTPGAEAMDWLWSVEPPEFHQLAGEPARGPIPNTYLVGKSVLPTLGQEGELLAAWSVAKLITKRNSTRQRMHRRMWTKIET